MSKVAVLIYTYDRVDDTRVNQEIIRENWTTDSGFEEVKIVHVFNGEQSWWSKKYLEDDLLYTDNPDHYIGAELMMNAGIFHIKEHYSDFDYVVVLASDTWLVKPEYISSLLAKMKKEEKYLATCAWGTKEADNIWKFGMGLDFYILDAQWLKKSGMFPLGYKEFRDKYDDLFLYQAEIAYLERVFAAKFKKAIFKTEGVTNLYQHKKLPEKFLLRLNEREPIHLFKGFIKKSKYRKMNWPELGLLGDHNAKPKQKSLKKLKPKLGENGEKLINSEDLSYWNNNKEETYRA